MAQTRSDEVKEEKAAKTNEPNRTLEIVWDDSNMRSTYSNVCNVSSTREEFTLLFGTNQSWHTGQKALKVVLTDRIILNPFAAKRLSVLINNVVKEYESRFGKLQVEAAEPKGVEGP